MTTPRCEAKHKTRHLARCGLYRGHGGYHSWLPKPCDCEHPEVKPGRFPECVACGACVMPALPSEGDADE